MTTKYYLAINEDTLELATFLNNGHQIQIEDRPTVLVCQIDSPREITTKIEYTLEVFGEDPGHNLVIGHHE